MEAEASRKGLLGRGVFWVVCTGLCIFLLATFVRVSEVNNLYRARFGDMVYGTAYRPYVSRALLPGMVRGITGLVPAERRTQWSAALESDPQIGPWLIEFKAESGLGVEAAVAGGLMLVSLLGFCMSFRRLLGGLYSIPPALLDLATFAALLLLVLFFGFGYIYDFTTLFLFTLNLNFLARGNWKAALISYPLVCLNKETAVLLILVLAVYGWDRLPRRLWAGLLTGQTLIFGVVKLVLDFMFRNNPGGATEYHLQDHLVVIRQFPILIGVVLLLLAGAAWLILSGWREKPVFLRRALVILLPLTGLYVFYGFPLELRAMYEVYPIVLALIFPTLARGVRALQPPDPQVH